MYEMMAGRSPFDIVGMDNPDQNSEDYLFQSQWLLFRFVILSSASDSLLSLVIQLRCFDFGIVRVGLVDCVEMDLFLILVILEKQIRIPRSLSVKAAAVLKAFLNKVIP